MVGRLLVVAVTAGFAGFTADPAAAQQKKSGAQSQEALAAKCRARVYNIMPNPDYTQRARFARLARTCMSNGGKL